MSIPNVPPPEKKPQTKPGVYSSEFWGLPAVLAAIPLDPDNAWAYVAAYGAYCLSRAIIKTCRIEIDRLGFRG
jgi:hypothetical protein